MNKINYNVIDSSQLEINISESNFIDVCVYAPGLKFKYKNYEFHSVFIGDLMYETLNDLQRGSYSMRSRISIGI